MLRRRAGFACIAVVSCGALLPLTVPTLASLQPPATGNPNEIQPHEETGLESSANASKVLKFESMTHDWGTIDDSKEVSHTFKFTNVSDREFTISRIRASCGCTTGVTEKMTYQPGESGEVSVKFNPENRMGTQNKLVTIESNDPDARRVVLRIMSKVVAQVIPEPKQVYFGEIKKGESATMLMSISGMGADFAITEVSSEDPRVTVKLLNTEKETVDGIDRQRVTAEVTLADTSNRAKIDTRLAFSTNNAAKPKFLIPVSAEVVGELRASPERLMVPVLSQGGPFEREGRFESRDGKPLKIRKASVAAPGMTNLTLDIEPVTEDSRIWRYRLAGNAPAAPGYFEGTLKFETDHPGEKELEVVFYGQPKQ